MRRRFVLLVVMTACASPGFHGGAPVSWSISRSDSPDGSSTTVCEYGQPAPCVLTRSTPEQPSYSGFALHVWGPRSTTFTGSLFIGFLQDPDPRRYKSTVDLTSDGRDIHHRVFSRVTTVPGEYSVRIQLTESRNGEPSREHNLSFAVTVQ